MKKVIGRIAGIFAVVGALCLVAGFSVSTAEAHGTLCGQTGYTTWNCTSLVNGKYFTASVPFGTGNLDYPNDVYNQSPTCDCVTFETPITGFDQTVCWPRTRSASSSDPPPKPGSSARPLYCGTAAGAHLHTKP